MVIIFPGTATFHMTLSDFLGPHLTIWPSNHLAIWHLAPHFLFIWPSHTLKVLLLLIWPSYGWYRGRGGSFCLHLPPKHLQWRRQLHLQQGQQAHVRIIVSSSPASSIVGKLHLFVIFRIFLQTWNLDLVSMPISNHFWCKGSHFQKANPHI